MSTTTISSSSSAQSVDSLIKQLVDKVDANKDGQISTNEFDSFGVAAPTSDITFPAAQTNQTTANSPASTQRMMSSVSMRVRPPNLPMTPKFAV